MHCEPNHLQNSQAVVDAFGYWPSFHDAPLFDVALNADELRFTVHGFVMTDEIDERGYFRLTKHHLVRFRFCGVRDLRLKFYEECDSDILAELVFAPSSADEIFQVSFSFHCGGEDGSFFARSGGGEELVLGVRTSRPQCPPARRCGRDVRAPRLSRK